MYWAESTAAETAAEKADMSVVVTVVCSAEMKVALWVVQMVCY